MERLSNYREKYLKYKSKYLELKKYGLNGPKYSMKGGALTLVPVEQIPKMHDLENEVQAYERYDQFNKDVNQLKAQFTAHKDAVNKSDKKKSLTDKNNKTFKEIHEQARLIALQEGMRLYSKWRTERSGMIARILKHFDDNGNVKSDSEPDLEPDIMRFFKSATWFNDLYKWTMYPVMRFIEKQEKFGSKPIHVKFQVDIRESTVRDALKDPVVQKKVLEALHKLSDRTFERDIFEQVSKEKGNILSKEDIDAICLKDGQPRKLVQVVSDQQDAHVPEDGVVIRCFYDENLHYDVPKKEPNDTITKVGTPGLLVIEAEGPWHLVTWLETSMMQCVYETYLKHQLQEGEYQPWLSKALLRCATSVAYTRIMQMWGGPTPALFTGRRTGGLPFLILQNLFFVDHFKQFVPPKMVEGVLKPQPPQPTISMYKKENEQLVKIPEIIEEATTCLGTSSVDAVLFLRTLLLEPDDGETRELMSKVTLPNVLPFVGTHAHELSMVLSVLYHNLDVNPLQLPFSQVLGHYLYEELVRKKTLGPLPMLSDTLGSPAFVIAASILLLNNCVFLSFVNSARQDSGDLVDFEHVLDLIGYKGGCMASEIDDTATLLKASLLTKYNTFGAGGYFGDSNKVFDKRGINISMAVKVVRVECAYKENEVVGHPPHITYVQKEDGTLMCIGYPIKTGDSSDITDEPGRQQISKFSADKTLSDEQLIDMKEYAIKTRENATKMLLTPELLSNAKAQVRRDVISISGPNLIIDTTPLQSLQSIAVGAGVKVGGGMKNKNIKSIRK